MRTVLPLKAVLLSIFSLLFMAMSVNIHASGLTDFEGNPKKIEDFTGNGKWTVVMFWASDCHVCNAEAHQYVAFQEKHKNGNIRMLGITLDGMSNKENFAAAKDFVKEHKLNFTNLIGEPETIGALYYDMTGNFFAGTPTFMIFSPDKIVRAADAGAIPAATIEEFIIEESVAKNEAE